MNVIIGCAPWTFGSEEDPSYLRGGSNFDLHQEPQGHYAFGQNIITVDRIGSKWRSAQVNEYKKLSRGQFKIESCCQVVVCEICFPSPA